MTKIEYWNWFGNSREGGVRETKMRIFRVQSIRRMIVYLVLTITALDGAEFTSFGSTGDQLVALFVALSQVGESWRKSRLSVTRPFLSLRTIVGCRQSPRGRIWDQVWPNLISNIHRISVSLCTALVGLDNTQLGDAACKPIAHSLCYCESTPFNLEDGGNKQDLSAVADGVTKHPQTWGRHLQFGPNLLHEDMDTQDLLTRALDLVISVIQVVLCGLSIYVWWYTTSPSEASSVRPFRWRYLQMTY